MDITFADVRTETPTADTLAAAYGEINARLDAGEAAPAIAAWEQLRREIDSWSALVYLRFEQDTTNAAAKAAQEYRDELMPTATALETAFKRRLLAHPDAAEVAAITGGHALRLWQMDVTTFEPIIETDLQEESKLQARYTALLASAKIEIDGETVNLSGLAPYDQSLDRDTRHRAAAGRWAFFAANAAAFDDIYDALVKLRHGMARKLGFHNYIELGYRRMRRVDYAAADVARYRDEIRTHVTPLVAKIFEARRLANGWPSFHSWDEALTDPLGNPKPAERHEIWRRLELIYEPWTDYGDLSYPAKGAYWQVQGHIYGVPYIFANFNGTHHDIDVFTHEMGHAFQNWQSRAQPGFDYLWPTMESAEIHSMSLEFLAEPHIEALVGAAAAERYRRMHLTESLAFLPYGALVDHFQHEVYAQPEATPAERHEIWRRLELIYEPWTDYGDLSYPAKGAYWQVQGHIYGVPFYYIDYTLALCCALQFWLKSRRDYGTAMDDYVTLCGRGGAAPFQELVASAGLISPFAAGALADVVQEAAAALA